MVKLLNRAKMSVSGTPSTGNITLNAAVTNYQTFAQAGAVDTDVIRYAVEDGSNWEVGSAVLSSSATVMTRTVEESSNSNNPVDLTSSAIVFATVSAADFEANPAPRWATEPASTLALENDGSTAVTLTGVAVDEAGFPVRYSWDGYSGSTIYDADNLPPQLASAPSINQNTGVTSLVGSSTTSNAGTYYHRSRATDGINTLSSTTAISLNFNIDVSNASYLSQSPSISSQEGNAYTLAFDTNGTKLFIAGAGGKAFQYSLSTAFDVTTASYSNKSFTFPGTFRARGLNFDSTGTSMYAAYSNTLYQFSLSTAFDVSTANSSATYTFNASSQDTSLVGLQFSNDGTVMYVCGDSSDKIHQYSLSTAWNISTASYSNKTLDNSSQTTYGRGMAILNSGMQMFIVAANEIIYQYDLSTAWDISTGSYSGKSFYASQDSVPGYSANIDGIAFNSDSTRMYALGRTNDRVYQYSVS